jgi:Flp pilus assembly protein TadD
VGQPRRNLRLPAALAAAATAWALAVFASRVLSTADATPFDRLELAARLDPLDGELRVQLAESWASAGRCDLARPHLDAARALLPEHPRLWRIGRRCP